TIRPQQGEVQRRFVSQRLGGMPVRPAKRRAHFPASGKLGKSVLIGKYREQTDSGSSRMDSLGLPLLENHSEDEGVSCIKPVLPLGTNPQRRHPISPASFE
ncbi:hypothetical protein P7K49_005605, partial [Saguinus oedipus]